MCTTIEAMTELRIIILIDYISSSTKNHPTLNMKFKLDVMFYNTKVIKEQVMLFLFGYQNSMNNFHVITNSISSEKTISILYSI